MSSKRPPAPPPDLGGYRYLSLLGSGGFSDVYLYEQDRPRRKVAVKVLVSDLRTESARRQFETEANLMAQLSSHPYIVTIYEAQTTETGHSYLAMEYCSRPSLDIRYRRERLSVDEVLAIGVQVASAVETAHRAGIAHRDIKPANILTTDYNRPALTDFGISGTVEGGADDDLGMSIPWSPPESFRGGPVDGVRLDVWALGATLYTLIAGRSPFAASDGDNSQRSLISRISTQPVPRTGRADVPESLELVLATAMAKAPEARYSSAHTFALALQRIQSELGLSVTPFEVLAEPAYDDRPDDGVEATRVRGIVAISPEGPTSRSAARTSPPPRLAESSTAHGSRGPGAARGPAAASESAAAPPAPIFPPRRSPDAGPTRPRSAVPVPSRPEADEATVLRGAALAPVAPEAADLDAAAHGGEAARSRRRRAVVLGSIGGAVLVGAVVAGGLLAPSLAQRPANTPSPAATGKPIDASDTGSVPAVTNLTAADAGANVRFTWANPAPHPGDSYLVTVLRLNGQTAPSVVTATETTLPKAASGQTCVRVVIRRSDGAVGVMDESAPSACFPR
ncbi:serine/threonine-protein kinase [Sinomonas sp. JGH33]|uniref:non-specific serine/threonine protein kinase n=1 Tax=Sinomonas terricola TaxID=3110330 RepID=A0ABU5T5A5_9MICC|nr:serine/threonine-protein kinase [Sinomonas sp. JGH33]MEA5454694.1 serine/threonine-protein kinase [Sinomonas sp. JGH33]